MFTDPGQRFFVSNLEVDIYEFVGKGGELIGEAGTVLARQIRCPRVRVILDKKSSIKKVQYEINKFFS